MLKPGINIGMRTVTIYGIYLKPVEMSKIS